jgi:hypothetical protein
LLFAAAPFFFFLSALRGQRGDEGPPEAPERAAGSPERLSSARRRGDRSRRRGGFRVLFPLLPARAFGAAFFFLVVLGFGGDAAVASLAYSTFFFFSFLAAVVPLDDEHGQPVSQRGPHQGVRRRRGLGVVTTMMIMTTTCLVLCRRHHGDGFFCARGCRCLHVGSGRSQSVAQRGPIRVARSKNGGRGSSSSSSFLAAAVVVVFLSLTRRRARGAAVRRAGVVDVSAVAARPFFPSLL